MRFLILIFRWLYNISEDIVGPKLVKVNIDNILIEEKFNIRIYGSDKIKTKPIMIYYHGGGWIAGGIKAYDRILRYISYHANYICVAIDYRKAPENKFPIPLDDVQRGYEWVIENCKTINGDIDNITLCGDSAGGNLIISLYHNFILQKNIIQPKNLVLIYPLLETNITKDSDTTVLKTLIYYISQAVLNFFKSQYIDNNISENSNYISLVSEAINYDYNCKIFIITAQYDALTYGINDYVDKLLKQNLNVKLKEYNNVIHGFMNFAAISTNAQTAIDDIVAYISKH